jgi:hypothetical protein
MASRLVGERFETGLWCNDLSSSGRISVLLSMSRPMSRVDSSNIYSVVEILTCMASDIGFFGMQGAVFAAPRVDSDRAQKIDVAYSLSSEASAT